MRVVPVLFSSAGRYGPQHVSSVFEDGSNVVPFLAIGAGLQRENFDFAALCLQQSDGRRAFR